MTYHIKFTTAYKKSYKRAKYKRANGFGKFLI